jgi:hypothetical protein
MYLPNEERGITERRRALTPEPQVPSSFGKVDRLDLNPEIEPTETENYASPVDAEIW